MMQGIAMRADAYTVPIRPKIRANVHHAKLVLHMMANETSIDHFAERNKCVASMFVLAIFVKFV
jgi:hypothetical protein